MKALDRASHDAKRNLVIGAIHSAVMLQMGEGGLKRIDFSLNDPRTGPRCTMEVEGVINMDQLADDVLKELDA